MFNKKIKREREEIIIPYPTPHSLNKGTSRYLRVVIVLKRTDCCHIVELVNMTRCIISESNAK
jgi:hypothetical protein